MKKNFTKSLALILLLALMVNVGTLGHTEDPEPHGRITSSITF